MFDTTLPPLAGVLAPRRPAHLDRWQRALQKLALPEGLLAMAHALAGLPQLEDGARRDFTLLLLLVLANQAQGSALLPLDGQGRMTELLGAFGEEPRDWDALLAREELAGLVGAAGKPLVLEGRSLYSGRFHQAELRVAEAARGRGPGGELAQAPGEEVLDHPVRLSSEQRAAVAAAARPGGFTLVTGGPGTGKTSIVVAILRALMRGADPVRAADVVLAAPTGKAAQRMGQAIRDSLNGLARSGGLDPLDQALLASAEPQTLHRLLGYNPGTGAFRHHPGNPLAARVVIVDEASMIGLELMEALLAAVPAEARLVLLGDADQLPSVEAGRAFGDLVEALPAQAARLEHSYRMDRPGSGGRHILLVAKAVNEGRPELLNEGEAFLPQRAALDELQRVGVELLAPAALKPFLQDWDRRWLATLADGSKLDDLIFAPLSPEPGLEPWAREADRIRRLVEHYDRSRVLAPLNELVDRLNRHFHEQALARSRQRLERHLGLILGEPVMVLRNDHRRGLFNGDQGVVLLVEREGARRPEVFFPRGKGFASYPLAAIQDDLELCYAMTIHKAQGSEYQRVAVVLPDREAPLLTREILYTALTRSGEAVTLVGDPRILEAAIATRTLRHSGLGGRLA